MSDTPKTDAQNPITPSEVDDVWIYNAPMVNADFARQLERELAAAAIELRTLRTANAGLVEKIQDMESARTRAAANSLANMLAYEDAMKKIAALIKEGDELAKIVRRDYRGAFCEDWAKAKGQP